MKYIYILFLLVCSTRLFASQAPWVGGDLNGLPCSNRAIGQAYGPWDYTKANEKPKIPIVEQYHFTSEVENHIKGISGTIEGDIDYTLRAVPNHHRALFSAIRYQLKLKKKLLARHVPLLSPAECYLQRAIHFSPEDFASVSLFAYLLKESNQPEMADKQYQKALSLSPDNAKTEYAYSQFLIELKQYDKALVYAKKAYQHGKPPEGLKKKLIQLNAWK